ncbi:MAG: glycosyltransferase, partial [Patescibacteria group bacterium]
MKATAIIIHWNTLELLRKQLVLLKPNKDIEVIIVDNKSDESVDWVKKDFKNIILIKNSINVGYAGGCNSGAKIAKGDWLLFLNPDVLITDKQIFEMIDLAEKNNFDAASPEPGSTNYQKPLPSLLSLLVEFTPLNKFYNFKNFITLKTLFGGCLLIKRLVLKKLGGWDEQFFL